MAGPPLDEPVLALDDIQGNTVPGFLKDNQHFLFFTIDDAAAARKCLKKMGDRISTATAVLKSHQEWKEARKRLGREPDPGKYAFLNVAFSAAGLGKLTSKAEVDQFEDQPFKQGLAKRSTIIGDPSDQKKSGHASGWLVGGPDRSVDGVFIVASDDLTFLSAATKKIEEEVTAQGMRMIHRDLGSVASAPEPGHEHFGFKDGVSQPSIRGRWPTAPYDFVSPRTLPTDKTFDTLRATFAEPGGMLVWPGHFLFGYGRQKADEPQAYNEKDQAKCPPWANNGSLVVYRRLRQNPKAFWQYADDTAKQLKKKYPKVAPDKEHFAAMMIGRWKSGTPLVRSPDKDTVLTLEQSNYFLYTAKADPPLPGDTLPQAADPDGLHCPFGAHIRKVNPRDHATDFGLPERTLLRSLLRRGITYGVNDDDKGLLFVAYQSSIANQFEKLMQVWVNDPNKPLEKGGQDPILALGDKREFYVNIGGTGDAVEKLTVAGEFIVPTGGEYFFSPAIAFFKKALG
jgi:Dyp-type peroxidase family